MEMQANSWKHSLIQNYKSLEIIIILNMKKRLGVFVFIILLLSMFVVAETEEECGVWCKVGEFFDKFLGRENVAGGAGTVPLYTDFQSLSPQDRARAEQVLKSFVESSSNKLKPNVYRASSKDILISDLKLAGLISLNDIGNNNPEGAYEIKKEGNQWVFKSTLSGGTAIVQRASGLKYDLQRIQTAQASTQPPVLTPQNIVGGPLVERVQQALSNHKLEIKEENSKTIVYKDGEPQSEIEATGLEIGVTSDGGIFLLHSNGVVNLNSEGRWISYTGDISVSNQQQSALATGASPTRSFPAAAPEPEPAAVPMGPPNPFILTAKKSDGTEVKIDCQRFPARCEEVKTEQKQLLDSASKYVDDYVVVRLSECGKDDTVCVARLKNTAIAEFLRDSSDSAGFDQTLDDAVSHTQQYSSDQDALNDLQAKQKTIDLTSLQQQADNAQKEYDNCGFLGIKVFCGTEKEQVQKAKTELAAATIDKDRLTAQVDKIKDSLPSQTPQTAAPSGISQVENIRTLRALLQNKFNNEEIKKLAEQSSILGQEITLSEKNGAAHKFKIDFELITAAKLERIPDDEVKTIAGTDSYKQVEAAYNPAAATTAPPGLVGLPVPSPESAVSPVSAPSPSHLQTLEKDYAYFSSNLKNRLTYAQERYDDCGLWGIKWGCGGEEDELKYLKGEYNRQQVELAERYKNLPSGGPADYAKAFERYRELDPVGFSSDPENLHKYASALEASGQKVKAIEALKEHASLVSDPKQKAGILREAADLLEQSAPSKNLADPLRKEAQELKKRANELDPPLLVGPPLPPAPAPDATEKIKITGTAANTIALELAKKYDVNDLIDSDPETVKNLPQQIVIDNVLAELRYIKVRGVNQWTYVNINTGKHIPVKTGSKVIVEIIPQPALVPPTPPHLSSFPSSPTIPTFQNIIQLDKDYETARKKVEEYNQEAQKLRDQADDLDENDPKRTELEADIKTAEANARRETESAEKILNEIRGRPSGESALSEALILDKLRRGFRGDKDGITYSEASDEFEAQAARWQEEVTRDVSLIKAYDDKEEAKLQYEALKKEISKLDVKKDKDRISKENKKLEESKKKYETASANYKEEAEKSAYGNGIKFLKVKSKTAKTVYENKLNELNRLVKPPGENIEKALNLQSDVEKARRERDSAKAVFEEAEANLQEDVDIDVQSLQEKYTEADVKYTLKSSEFDELLKVLSDVEKDYLKKEAELKSVLAIAKLASEEVAREYQEAFDDAGKQAKEAQKKAARAKELEDRAFWQSTWFDTLQNSEWYKTAKEYGTYAGGVAKQLASLGEYKALSNLLFPTATQNFIEFANDETLNKWSNLPTFIGTAVADGLGVEICQIDDLKRSKIPGSATTFVKTKGSTYQFVGSIAGEKFDDDGRGTVPIQCIENPIEEEREEKPFICSDETFVCKDGVFCYKDENAKEPEKGIFYKISWGVTAPQDEKSTPFIDEDNKSVKFNIGFTKETTGENQPDLKQMYWIYEVVDEQTGIPTADETVIALANGESDQDTQVAFLKENYEEVCIIFSTQGLREDKGYVTDSDSGDPVTHICAPLIDTENGHVQFSGSEKSAASRSSSSPQVRSRLG